MAKVFSIVKWLFPLVNLYVYIIEKGRHDDPRLQNLFYKKSKLESINETSALLSGFAIVTFYSHFIYNYTFSLIFFQDSHRRTFT